jgi:hypothetical protein
MEPSVAGRHFRRRAVSEAGALFILRFELYQRSDKGFQFWCVASVILPLASLGPYR